MTRLGGMLVALSASIYVVTYALHVWRRERNPAGAAALAILALASLALPFYVLYLR